jgi:hypothetical protein
VNPLCIQCVHVGFVIAQPLYVFKTGSAGEDVIGTVQYMIALSNPNLHTSLCMALIPPKVNQRISNLPSRPRTICGKPRQPSARDSESDEIGLVIQLMMCRSDGI